jgi:hemoglobin/transferrin/lactoferrin receptor protein
VNFFGFSFQDSGGSVVVSGPMKLKAGLMFGCLVMPGVGQDFLKPVVVTASRVEREAVDEAYSTVLLSDDELRESFRRTLPEALQLTPGVLVQKTAHGHGSPFIRGFTGRQNLLMVDGVRLNNSTWRSGPVQYWNTVDPFSIDHVELVLSQGSVMYGSDAIGGTLNAFTKSSGFEDVADGEFFNHGAAIYEFRGNGRGSHVGRLETQFGVGGKYGVHLGISAKEFGDIRDSAVGLMRETGHPEQDVDFRFDAMLSQGVQLTVAHQYVNQDDISRWHRTVNNPGWTHGSHVAAAGTFLDNLYDQERSLTYVRLAGENDAADAAIRRWSATLSYQKSQDSELQLRTPADSRRNVVDVDTYGLDVSFESRVGPGTLVYGADYYVDDISSGAERAGAPGIFTARPDDRVLADDASYHLAGAYAQYEWSPVDRLSLTGGLRYTWVEAEWDNYRAPGSPADVGGTESWDNLSASVRALLTIDEEWSAYAGLSQAFRAPNMSDLTGNQLALAGDTVLGGDVDPEEFLTAELGVRRHSETFDGSVAVFHTWTDGAVVAEGAGLTRRVTNGQDGWLYGIEAQGAWRFSPGWELRGGVAWQEGKTETAANGERWMTRLVPFSGTVALRWTDSSEKWWVEGRVTGAVGEGRIHPADQAADNQRIPTNGTPGYVVASLYAGWKATDWLEFNAGVENVMDEDYRVHGSGQNEPGLSGLLGVKMGW